MAKFPNAVSRPDADGDPTGWKAVTAPAVSVEDLVDHQALADYLRETVGGDGPLEVRRHQEGHSNETLFVTWGEEELVLRRPPPGETAETAHDVLREYEVMSSLAETNVPVPPAVAGCADESVIGCEFFLTERLAGDVIRDEEPERFREPGAREHISEAVLDTLAAIHDVDDDVVGLGDFGRPEGYLERQVAGWREQLEDWLLPKTENDRELSHLRDVGEWLAANVPTEADHTLVQGDFKLDNLMFAPGLPPELIGVFDWEMSTLGDPLADLAWLLRFWHDPGDPDFGVHDEFAPTVTTREGYPGRRDLVSGYERRTGRTFDHQRFHRTLAEYKLAVACEAMYLRYLTGASDDPIYPLLEDAVPAMANRARAIVDGEFPL